MKVRLLDINGVREWTLKYIYSKFDFWFSNCTYDFVWKIWPRRDSNPRLPDPLAATHLRWVCSKPLCHAVTGSTSTPQSYIHTKSTSKFIYTREFLFSSNHKSDVWAVIDCIYCLVTHIYQMKTHPGSVYRPMHTLTHVLCLLFRLVSSVESPLWVS